VPSELDRIIARVCDWYLGANEDERRTLREVVRATKGPIVPVRDRFAVFVRRSATSPYGSAPATWFC